MARRAACDNGTLNFGTCTRAIGDTDFGTVGNASAHLQTAAPGVGRRWTVSLQIPQHDAAEALNLLFMEQRKADGADVKRSDMSSSLSSVTLALRHALLA